MASVSMRFLLTVVCAVVAIIWMLDRSAPLAVIRTPQGGLLTLINETATERPRPVEIPPPPPGPLTEGAPLRPDQRRNVAALLSSFAASCSAIPWVQHFRATMPLGGAQPMPFAVKSHPICVGGNGQYYASHAEPQPLQFAHHTSNAFRANATWQPLRSDQSEETLLALQKLGDLKLHHAVGLLMFGRWATINVFHFTADVLLAAAVFLVAHPNVMSTPHLGVLAHESRIITGYDKGASVCAPCVAGIDALNSSVDAASAVDKIDSPIVLPRHGLFTDAAGAHCFCGGVMVSSLSQRLRRNTEHKKMFGSAVWHLKRRLAVRYSLAPYGTTASPKDLSTSLVWGDAPASCSGPRLLMVLRSSTRLFANTDNISAMASNAGFCVRQVLFETLSSSDQFRAARYADVILGMHGAALTYLYMMDPLVGRKTVVELLPWVATGKVAHNLEFGQLCNVSVVQVEATGVVFGHSVRNKKRERKLLHQHSSNVHGMAGFNDQLALHSLSAVHAALMAARQLDIKH